MRAQYDFSKAKRGAVLPAPRGKTRITIRIDADVLDWFRARVHEAGGGSYQSLINLALRDHIARREERLEETLRRVLREELPSPGRPRAETRKEKARRVGRGSPRTTGTG
ncbi:MAG: BrnA antitoxin family protein [Candidatus Eisenbacteria bacterium]|uniref:BrnA antitoxin family protein n=1 Tax=Eiseniibacteriota bacterium TaxID=2212470 RepID=A0A937XDA9_UNCEI|nr:BrnA antitoxin family protein [Candidatus Eisenbacteria bacterium]